MPPRQAPEQSPRPASPRPFDSHTGGVECLARRAAEELTRHEPQVLTARPVPRDPYATWIERREAEGPAASMLASTRASRRFVRDQREKAPWERILVTLSPDVR